MIFIKHNETGKVNYIHYMPFHEKHGLGKTTEQLEKEGILVEQLPDKLPELAGKTQELYFIGGQLQWQYEDIPKTEEDNRIEQLETALLEMTALSAIEKAQTEQAIMELTMMIGGM